MHGTLKRRLMNTVSYPGLAEEAYSPETSNVLRAAIQNYRDSRKENAYPFPADNG